MYNSFKHGWLSTLGAFKIQISRHHPDPLLKNDQGERVTICFCDAVQQTVLQSSEAHTAFLLTVVCVGCGSAVVNRLTFTSAHMPLVRASHMTKSCGASSHE